MKLRLERRLRIPRVPGWVLALLVAWLAIVAASGAVARWRNETIPICHFRAITGIPCATCGSTRAGLAIMEGRVLDALLLNPLIVSAGAIVASVLVFRLVTSRQVLLDVGPREKIVLWTLAAVAFLANWAHVIAQHAA
jgi:hypothetical protein